MKRGREKKENVKEKGERRNDKDKKNIEVKKVN
jgi:ribose 1,5-bisphosphokinase PhnN